MSKRTIVNNGASYPEPSIRYVLYSHYARSEKADFELWKINPTSNTNNYTAVSYLRDHLNGLEQLVTTPANEGLVVLFYSPGFPEFLFSLMDLTVRGDALRNELLRRHIELQFAQTVAKSVDEMISTSPALASRLRFVTALDLADVFGRFDFVQARDLRGFVYGFDDDMHYDAPKIVEAIVRLRLFGTGVPVLRLDHDVLFNDENSSKDTLGLLRPIVACLKAYEARRDDPRVSSFVFSGSYGLTSLQGKIENASFEEWNRAFATRLHPSLLIDRALLTDSSEKQVDWAEYARQSFRRSLAERFLGLEAGTMRVARPAFGIAKFGAHPTSAVISGALLCFSSTVSLLLPPFSNFNLNVSWIDDHLRYAIHRELGHVSKIRVAAPSILSTAKLDQVEVIKARASVSNIPSYTLDVYMPNVVRGCIVDRWISGSWARKFRCEELDGQVTQDSKDSRGEESQSGPLAIWLHKALERAGGLHQRELRELRSKLEEAAFERLTEIKTCWSDLMDGANESFASSWAKGSVGNYFDASNFASTSKGLWRGLVRPGTKDGAFVNRDTVNPDFLVDIERLIDDCIGYIYWACRWPTIAHAVLNINQGDVKTDVSWQAG